MSVLIFIDGALEPLQIDEPFQATFMNIGGAIKNGFAFFQTKNMSGEEIGIAIPRILYVQDVD